jgi:hypothetical protein
MLNNELQYNYKAWKTKYKLKNEYILKDINKIQQ